MSFTPPFPIGSCNNTARFLNVVLQQGLVIFPERTPYHTCWQGSAAASATALANAINLKCARFLPDLTYDGVFLNTKTTTAAAIPAEGGEFPLGIDFKPDGTRLYVVDGNDNISQYDLATPWLIETASHVGTFIDVGTDGLDIEKAPQEIRLHPDGTHFYLLGNNASADTDAYLWDFTLSTPWDISTATQTASFSLESVAADPEGLIVKSDGLQILISDPTAGAVLEYALSTAYDLSTMTLTATNTTLFGVGHKPSGLFMPPGLTDGFGEELWVVELTNEKIQAYDTTTPWDITSYARDDDTGVADLVALLSDAFINSFSIFVSPTREKLYISSISNDGVHQFSFGTCPVTASVDGDDITFCAQNGVDLDGAALEVTTADGLVLDPAVGAFSGFFSMPGVAVDPPNCTDKVSMAHNAADPSQLIIVDGTNGWIYDTTNGLVQITDSDYFSADVVDFQDQYFVQNRAGTGQFFLSNLNDGTAYTATDIATAEGDPDKIVSLISQRRELWLFGTETTEIWYNSGNADFPFSRFEGGFLERGCAAAFSIAEDDNSIFWLGEDRIFYRADGYQPVPISQHGIDEALRKYAIVSDACAFIYTMAGHKFYVCTFPAESATWVYDITTKLWHERHSAGMERWRVSTYAEAYGKHLVGDFKDGKIGELDLDTYQEYGLTMQGQATGPVVYADRKRIFHRRFELDIEAGTGLTTGQGSDPQVWLDWSDDGGHTFSARKPFRSMGKIGAYMQRLRWLSLGSARQRIYRLTVSDPVKRSIIAAHLDAEAGDH